MLRAYDTKGYRNEIATATGWADFAAYLRTKGGVLAQFGTDAFVEDVDALRMALDELEPPEAHMKATRDALIEALLGAEDCLIISDEPLQET